MNTGTDLPGETFRRLLAAAGDARRRRSLTAINQVCEILQGRGVNDFSYRTIVTLGRDRQMLVPSEKSIQNATGIHYRELIQAWREAFPSTQTAAEHQDWTSKIKDPVISMSVALLMKENRALKAKEARKQDHPSLPVILSEKGMASYVNMRCLNGAELFALEAAIDSASLALIGISFGSRGELIDSNGRQLFKPGFRDAIMKILSAHTNMQ